MVKSQGSQLDRTFAALGDPTRRAILARLEKDGSLSIGELARPFAIKLPAVMKHLDVLGTAGLISRSKTGRVVQVRLAPEPMAEAMDWLRRYERFWSVRLDRLAAYAEAQEAKAAGRKPRRANMTSLTLVRRIAARPSIVFEALTTPDGIACWWGPRRWTGAPG
ncbi:MAG: metalloregulator ArsR/SmtB family transcription factor [Acetobacteraceae bacterium]